MRERADWARGRRRSLRFAIGGIAAIGIAALSLGLAIAQSQINPALEAYVAGLDAIRQGRYQAAVDALTRATQSGSDPSFLLARGVALCLDEKLAQAIDDLSRAKNAGLRGREADLWIYSAQMMSSAHGRPLPGGRPGETWFGGVPGHVIQGRDDYPTDYASFVYYEMATPYSKGVTPAVREAMRQAGAWFANRAGTRPDLAPAHLARARTLYGQREYPAVLQELAFVRPLYPGNADLRFYSGITWLALGRPATARRELTVSLTALTRSPGDYLNRAYAAARMGDSARARVDFELAVKYQPGLQSKHQSSLDQEIAANRADGQPEQMLAALEQSARSGAPLESLVTQAVAFHRAMAPTRLRYDEWYQDRMREHEEAVLAAPASAAPYVALARFLIAEANLAYRGEDVEPRHGPVPFRWQLSRDAELRRAVSVCDEGLRAQPGNISAQTVKAIALVRLGQEREAEVIVNRVLASAPNNPEALAMKAKFLMERASRLFAQAAALRSPRVETSYRDETRSDGVYRVSTTTYYPPTQDALNRAAQLEAEAQALVRESNAALSAALTVLRGTFEGDMLAAEVDFALGRRDAAFAGLESALRRQPRSLEANQTLAEFYRRIGRNDESDRQMSVTTNLVHTNGGWLLRTAWRKAGAKDVAGARAALAAARRLDPVDARVPAYTGALFAQEGNAAEGAVFYRVALALEQARLRLDEQAKEGMALPREAEELAVVMKMRNALAAPFVDRQPQAALDYYGPNTVLARRITRAGRAAQMFGAMLPDPGAPPVPVPEPPNAAQLMAEAYNGAGRSLKALGRSQDAMREFQQAIDLTHKPGIPGVGSGRRGDTNFAGDAGGGASADAFIEMVKAALAAGDCQTASQAISRGTEARFPRDKLAEVNRLQFDIARCYQRRGR